jgi:anti-sigma B factor antagonist
MHCHNRTDATAPGGTASRALNGGDIGVGIGVEEKWVGRVVVVAVSGDVDMLTAPQLAGAINDAYRKGPAALIVDLSEVEFLASAGMTVLIQAHRDIATSARFGIVADSPATSRPLTLIGIDTVVAVYPTLGAALDNVSGHHA